MGDLPDIARVRGNYSDVMEYTQAETLQTTANTDTKTTDTQQLLCKGKGFQYHPFDEAKRILYPTIDPLRAEFFQRDSSIVSERDNAEEWTQRFFRAAFTALSLSGEPATKADAIETQAQDEQEEEIARRVPDLYDNSTLEARISLLFPMARSLHVGGEAICPLEGDPASWTDLDEESSFRRRLERIEHHLRMQKWLVIDLIEGQHMYKFIGNPDAYVESAKRMSLVQKRRALSCPLHGGTSVAPPAQSGEQPPQPLIESSKALSTESGEPSSIHLLAQTVVAGPSTFASRARDLRARGRSGPTGPDPVDSESNAQPRDSLSDIHGRRDMNLWSRKMQRIDSWVGRLPAPRYRPQRIRSDSCDSYYDSSD